MSDYLSNLLIRSLQPQTAIQPRRLGRYEPLPPGDGGAARPVGLEEFEETRLAEEGVRALEPSAATPPAAPLMAEVPSPIDIADQAPPIAPLSSFQADRPSPGQVSAVVLPTAAEAISSDVPRDPVAPAQSSDTEPDRRSLSVSVKASVAARELGQGSAREIKPVTATAPVSEPVQTQLEPVTVTVTSPSPESFAVTALESQAADAPPSLQAAPATLSERTVVTRPVQTRPESPGRLAHSEHGLEPVTVTVTSPSPESLEVIALELPAADEPPSLRAVSSNLPERTIAAQPVQIRLESPGQLADLEQPPGATQMIVQPRLSPERRPGYSEPPRPPATTAIQAEAPVIQVTIGRIEIRATPPAAAPPKPRSVSPRLTLEDYLRQRNGGKR